LARSGHAVFGREAAEGDAAEATCRRLDRFAFLLDEAFRIPGTRWRVGMDGVVGLVPGIGDAVTAVIALYPIVEAWRHGAPPALVARMLGNLGLDTAIGAVPLLGDIFDMRFKSNRRNVELLKRHLTASGAGGRRRETDRTRPRRR
jgi:Domain of unknown function (DUF4112)